MFELEEYSSGFHDGFLNKYTDSSGPTLDFYISDSLQDMIDVDIRSEVANVVGSAIDYETCLGEMPSTFDNGADTVPIISSSVATVKENSVGATWSPSNALGFGSSNSSSSWFGANSDFFADVGACVNPISVMPLISSSLIHLSPKVNLNANSIRSSSPPPPSPNVNDTKSHLTFSPAHIKISANSIRNEQLTSHIPKQIVPISSALTSATTAPATLATNSVLQRKNSAVEAIKKDLCADLRNGLRAAAVQPSNESTTFKISPNTLSNSNGSTSNLNASSAVNPVTNQSLNTTNNSNSSSTIKLGPGIGGLTFANNVTYNKIKQQATTKSSQSSTTITANGTIVLKRDRDSSPLHGIAALGGNAVQQVTKIMSRNMSSASSFTPKSIASSAHSSYVHQAQSNVATTSANTSNSGQGVSFSQAIFNNNGVNTTTVSTGNNSATSTMPMKQKMKSVPVESDFPKPSYSYSCLIAMALKNSRRGSLPVSEIYSFMCEHFPYFKTAPSGWKNSVRHNLSLNKCFEKIEKPPTNGNQRKGCLWAMNPERIAKMDEEVLKWSRKDPMAIRNAMVFPENLEALERGEMKHGSSGDSDLEMDSQSEIEEASDLEEQELDDNLVDNMLVEEDIDDDTIHSMSIRTEEVHLSDNEEDACDVPVNRLGTVHRTVSSPLPLASATPVVSNCIASMSDNVHRDFDIEVEDIYDSIDMDDDKEAVRLAMSQSDIIELSPADYNISGENHHSPKRARLNINYSIGPAGELEKQIKSQHRQVHIQGIKKIVKVQNIQDLQNIQQQLQHQQIVVQAVGTSGHHLSGGHFAPIGSISSFNDPQNRRNIQLVNRSS